MKISLESVRARWSFLAAIVLVAGGLGFMAGRIWLAAHWGASWDPDHLKRAASLEPTNAEYWHRLGFYEKWNFEQGDLHRSVDYYRRATEANPQSDKYWVDLAEAYEGVGQTLGARQAFEKAQSFHPISPDVAWRYGNFLLRRGNYSEAFAEIRRALATDPNLTVEAVAECSRAGNNLSMILREILPAQNRYYFLALNYFVSQRQPDAALTVWEQLRGLRQTFEMVQVVPFIDSLIGQKREEDALRVWQQALGVTAWPIGAKDSSSVFNGGFEQDLLAGGFDWREDPVPGAAFSFDRNVVHSGTRSLRIMFDGSSNLDFQNLHQFSPVEPGRRYRFAAYLRTEGISTDSGVRFAIYDAFRPTELQILTADLIGSHSWSLVETEFITSPETNLLTIALRRVPSEKFDNNLRGTVWVDDVSLVPVPPGAKENTR